MRNIPFHSNTFDLVYSMGTLEHVANTKQVVRKIYRVLKKDGVAITGVPNNHDLFFRSQVLDLANKLGIPLWRRTLFLHPSSLPVSWPRLSG